LNEALSKSRKKYTKRYKSGGGKSPFEGRDEVFLKGQPTREIGGNLTGGRWKEGKMKN